MRLIYWSYIDVEKIEKMKTRTVAGLPGVPKTLWFKHKEMASTFFSDIYYTTGSHPQSYRPIASTVRCSKTF